MTTPINKHLAENRQNCGKEDSSKIYRQIFITLTDSKFLFGINYHLNKIDDQQWNLELN